jgi:hypothetical protein
MSRVTPSPREGPPAPCQVNTTEALIGNRTALLSSTLSLQKEGPVRLTLKAVCYSLKKRDEIKLTWTVPQGAEGHLKTPLWQVRQMS